MANKILQYLFYITHINNVPSILKRGILSHKIVTDEDIKYTPIINKNIIANRQKKIIPDGRNLWQFANLYFQPRNPMMYRVICEASPDDLCVIAVQKNALLNRPDIWIADGNAASEATEIFPNIENRNLLFQINKDVEREWWFEHDGSKRKMMAECLVPESISQELIKTIYVANQQAKDKIGKLIHANLPIIIESNIFFQPSYIIPIESNITISEGDMFFSRKHTLTVSVNCVGVMGKGVASRAKYQFPDVYVIYQEIDI